MNDDRVPIPRDAQDDYTGPMAQRRREFVAEHRREARASHITRSSRHRSPATSNFLGVAQVPIGLAGPLRILGEHAQGDFYVPLATTEGTLVASYSRGMRALGKRRRHRHGGQALDAASAVFRFRDAREHGLRAVAGRAVPGDQGRGRVDDARRQAARHRTVRARQPALHASTTRRATRPART